MGATATCLLPGVACLLCLIDRFAIQSFRGRSLGNGVCVAVIPGAGQAVRPKERCHLLPFLPDGSVLRPGQRAPRLRGEGTVGVQ